MSELLFEVPRNKTRLELVKEKHQIETWDDHSDSGNRWMAICKPYVVEKLSGYGATKEMTVPDLIAKYCRLLDEAGYLDYGKTEIDSVVDVCRNNNIYVIL